MLIGITGKKYSGKDTAGNHLIKNYKFTRYALADPLKKAVKEIFMLSDDQVWGHLKEAIDKRYGVTPRKLLQIIGTELFRNDIFSYLPGSFKIPYGKIWINRFKLWYEKNKKYWKMTDYTGVGKYFERNVVVTDVRFLDEAEVIKKLGGIVIKIERPILNYRKDDHSSEIYINYIKTDYTIINDGSIKDLEKKIDIVLDTHYKYMNLHKLR